MTTLDAEIERLGLVPYRPPPPVVTMDIPEEVSIGASLAGANMGESARERFAKLRPVPTRDVLAALWCGKVLNWFGRILIWASQVIFRQAPRVHKFAAAHVFGPVSVRREIDREKACFACEHRKLTTAFEECSAEHCACGEWRLANLAHKRKLSGYKCADGRWGYGWLAAWYYARHENKKLVAMRAGVDADGGQAVANGTTESAR